MSENMKYDEIHIIGNTTVCVVEPVIESKEDIDCILEEFHDISREIVDNILKNRDK
ncbi:hypothetical protein [Tepidibacter hydrothermalis]|uniref:Uncharacterized protein n=1 Tax=Tepidibacter hydrothermalis TaxID=3036126 RepID=A0ABY8EDT2_9FIRM|nr:hypothetical protein [Tepidibacter hydrothermalis]WFD09000.1 hypothetical protein P4S50_11445 [Tepidibacter hydrothermalis]